FNGQGLLHNNGDGMMLADGASLGQVGLVNGGDLSLGIEVPGQAFVDRFVNEDDGILHVEIGGTTPGTQLTQLFVTGGTAQLAGTLAAELVDAGGLFAPELGDQFTILIAAGGVVGEFDWLVQPAGLPTGMLLELQYTANSVVLYVDSTYAADFDRDGDVDGDDLPRWLESFDNDNGGDADNDGDSDGADFLVWHRQLGSVPAVPAGAAVPEPAVPAVVATACLAGLLRRRRK
ncbi:MAG: PEP-CTERM sorting domain-containing protein, partial [Pirellulales bacterium]|nr:PEP-CTERM sorting domain-containing protein [Pirellulales bacterium]